MAPVARKETEGGAAHRRREREGGAPTEGEERHAGGGRGTTL
jgi:hypothetical protein